MNPPAWAALLTILLASLPTLATAQEAPDAPVAEVDPRVQLAARHPATLLADIASGDVEAREVWLLQLAYLESTQALPRGIAAALRAATHAAEEQPRETESNSVMRFPHIICDVDNDEVQDYASNEVDGFTQATKLVVKSGANGTAIWERLGGLYIAPRTLVATFDLMSRQGVPAPNERPNFALMADVNSDGVCDLLQLRMAVRGTSLPLNLLRIFIVDAEFAMLSGVDGQILWRLGVDGQVVQQFDPITQGTAIVMRDMLSGVLYGVTESGPVLVYKTTTTLYNERTTHPVPPWLGCFARDWRNSEVIFYVEAGANPVRVWQRTVSELAQQGERAADTQFYFLAGLVDSQGTPELEVLVDGFRIAPTPRTCVTNRELLVLSTGEGYAVWAEMLRAEDGATQWRTIAYDTGTARVRLPVEESYEDPLWAYAFPIRDITGDGTGDVVLALLMVEQNLITTSSGRFSTHIFPMDGRTGARLWGDLDVKLQGWGYPAVLRSGSDAYLAYGTIDIPTPVPSGGRFPPKDVRITVFNGTDGTIHWTYREQFSQRSFVAFDMTLHQYACCLASYDLDGDGILDVATPARYMPPQGTNQTLLSTSTHDYLILRGRDGEPIERIQSWGPTGMLIACGSATKQYTVVSGYARRLAMESVSFAGSARNNWSHTVWYDPAPVSATRGIEVLFFWARCMVGEDGRQAYGLNVGTFSDRRSLDVLTPHGMMVEEGRFLVWRIPEIDQNATVDPILIQEAFQPAPPPVAAKAVAYVLPSLSAALAGLGVGKLILRFRGKA